MTQPLWQKSTSSMPDENIQQFLAGDDVLLDREIFPFDIQATVEHVRGLHRIGRLNDQECASIESALDELLVQFTDGQFVLDDQFEDGHSAIEFFLTEQLGETGKRVHLGRSRNDQVLVAVRLYIRDKLSEIQDIVTGAAAVGAELPPQDETSRQPPPHQKGSEVPDAARRRSSTRSAN